MEEPVEYKIQGAIRIALEEKTGICPYEVIFVDQKNACR